MSKCAKTGKTKFNTQLDAKLSIAAAQAANKRNRKRKFREEPVRHYKCEFCLKYHLTSAG